ncbi:hypothetical protein BN1723_017407, partial [Verticillium longisporum]
MLLPERTGRDDAPLARRRPDNGLRQQRRRCEDARLEYARHGEAVAVLPGQAVDEGVDAVAGDEDAVVLLELARVSEVLEDNLGAAFYVFAIVDAGGAFWRGC